MRKWLQKNLGRQLSQPSGFWGIVVGRVMNLGNRPMYRATYELLEFHPGDQVLEIGFGNGALVQPLLPKIRPGTYTGIELSDTMLKVARQNLRLSIQAGEVVLKRANAQKLPFADQSFDKIFTINTIYFWEKPERVMAEVYRVLKPNGIFVISLNTQEAMQGSEYVREKFTLYSRPEVEQLFEKAGFQKLISTHQKLRVEDVLCVRGRK